MSFWDRLRVELDRAGRAAQHTFDDGKLRLELMRARQSADRAAQRLGYAVFRARRGGADLPEETYAALAADLTAAEAQVARYETMVDELAAKRKSTTSENR